MPPTRVPSGRAVHVVVFEGLADWEPGHALAELRRSGQRTVVTIGFTSSPVKTMGGLTLLPDVTLGDVRAADVELLLLPGGDLWESDAYPREPLEALVMALLAAEVPVAAICGATLAVARAGALDDRRHTSNMLAYVEQYAPDYRGQANYVEALAVRDRHLITASGLGAVDFAREIFAELAVFGAADQQLWFDMFKHGKIPSTV